MKNRIIFIVIGIIAFLLIISFVLILVFNGNKYVKVNFETGSNEVIESMKIKKGKSITLPNVLKEGFKFLGWYLGDVKITNETKFYKNTTIVAKWLDESVKTFTITFDTDEGSNVDPLMVECGKKVKFSSNPTKNGYEFISWVDENEKVILDGAILECKDITLKANWKKDDVVEEKKETKTDSKTETKKEKKTKTITEETKEEVKQTTYSCPTEYVLEGTKCTLTKDATYGCDSQHEKKYNDKCYSVRTYKEATCKLQDGSTGTGSSIQPNLVDGIVIYKDSTTVYCAYEKQGSLSSCNDYPERIINGSSCYKKVETRSIASVCQTGYDYIIGNALYGTIEKGTSASSGCYQGVRQHFYCEKDYTLLDNKCIKTIDANLG